MSDETCYLILAVMGLLGVLILLLAVAYIRMGLILWDGLMKAVNLNKLSTWKAVFVKLTFLAFWPVFMFMAAWRDNKRI